MEPEWDQNRLRLRPIGWCGLPQFLAVDAGDPGKDSGLGVRLTGVGNSPASSPYHRPNQDARAD